MVFILLHFVARNRYIGLVDILHSKLPTTLNRCDFHRQTPLFLACSIGHASVVSKLLSLGATQRTPSDEASTFPLTMAAVKGFVDVVRVLINEGGIRAGGDVMVLTNPLYASIRSRQARILRLLLTVGREEGRAELTNANLMGIRLLHCGAGYCYPAAVSLLLEAGADWTARHSEGRIRQDAIGVDIHQNDQVQMDRGKEAAVGRMLQRGPSYRARSWAWASDDGADIGGSGDGDTNAAASATSAALASRPAAKIPVVVAFRVFRPIEQQQQVLRETHWQMSAIVRSWCFMASSFCQSWLFRGG